MTDPIVPTLVESVPANPVPEAPTPALPAEVVVTPETPTVPQVPVETPPAAEKFKLPDGQEVTPQELYDLHVNKLLPEFTQKSQKLAEYEKINKPPEDNLPVWKRADYVPQTYAEVIEIAKQAAIEELSQKGEQERARLQEVSSQVDAQVSAIKATDPSLDENALFLHANKFGFRDLTQAYENMKHIKQITLDTEQRVLKNVTKRADPVGAGGVVPSEGLNPGSHTQYGSALEFLQRIKGN